MPATYEKIASTTVSGTTTSQISFSSLPSTYTDLRVVLVTKGDQDQNSYIRFNSDTGTNYSYTRINTNGVTAATFNSTNATAVLLQDSGTIEQFTLVTIDIMGYAGSTNKTFLSTNSGDTNNVDNTLNRIVGLWRNTSAISSILLYQGAGNYVAGTTATVYGILKA